MMETLPAADIPESHAVPYEAGSTVERVTAHVDVPAMSHDQNETAEVSKEESKLSDRAEVDEARHSHRVASGISFAKAMVVFNLIALGILLVITVATFGVILLFFWPQFLGALVLGNVVVCLLFLGRRFRRRAGSP